MYETKVTTDRKWKPFKYRNEVPKRVLESQFDYHDDDTSDMYFKYGRTWYHVDQFVHIPNGGPLSGWDGVLNESWSSGVLLKISPDAEQYQVGSYYLKSQG